jgi:hypothetical protein
MVRRERSANPERVDVRLVLHARVPELLEHDGLVGLRRRVCVRLDPERAPLLEGDIRAGMVKRRLPVQRIPGAPSALGVGGCAVSDAHVVHGKVEVLDAEVRDKVLASAAVERVVVHA